ncbi:very short patch repair endonuclease [Desulfomicrobium macestii]|nr:very short patch repair endonuclease [Desulfomicrobium macestii]
MTDSLSSQERSERMSRIRGKDSAPEIRLRRLVHKLGYRYRLHVKELPGTPDLVFPSRRAVIFMHGCFWHRHEGCKLARLPKSKLDFWKKKLDSNKNRDALQQQRLYELGWRVLVIWECELDDADRLVMTIRKFLDEPTRGQS